jgi:hypothetical protein
MLLTTSGAVGVEKPLENLQEDCFIKSTNIMIHVAPCMCGGMLAVGLEVGLREGQIA